MGLQLLNIFSKITPRSQATGGKATNKGNKLLKTMLTDSEIINAFQLRNTGKNIYEATFIPMGEKSTVDNWEQLLFTANSKEEAVRVAREYGNRILFKKLRYVYRHRG